MFGLEIKCVVMMLFVGWGFWEREEYVFERVVRLCVRVGVLRRWLLGRMFVLVGVVLWWVVK